MSWLYLTVAAELIAAVVSLTDKYIVTDEKVLPRPFVYAFYTCLIAGGWIVVYFIGLLPFSIGGFHVPSFTNVMRPTLEVVAFSILAAYCFFFALVSLFTALKQADASDVVPVVGAISALGSFALGYFFLDTQLSPNFVFGIALLATGTFLVSHYRFQLKVAMHAMHAGLFFALHYVAIKGLFNLTGFDNGFFWSRIAFVAFALSLLLVPAYFEKIRTQTKQTSRSTGFLVIGNKLLAGVGTIMILKATALASNAAVPVIQALGGLQFVFILLIGILIGHKTPTSCGEESCRRRDVTQKAIFVAIISFGFLVLFI